MEDEEEIKSQSPNNLEVEKNSLHDKECENAAPKNVVLKAESKQCTCKQPQCENCTKKDDCEIFKGDVEQKIEEAKQSLEKRKSSKTKLWNFIFLLINVIVIAVIVIYQVNTEEGLSFEFLASSIGDRWWCLVCALFAFFGVMLCETIRNWILLYSSSKHNRPFLSYKVAGMGAYYDNITPLAVGGQPFQIFYMINRGEKPSVASGVPLARTIFGQLAFAITGFCVLIFSKVIAGGLEKVTYYAAVLGIVFQVLCTATILLLSISKKIGPAIVKGVLKFLSKIKIVKDSEKLYEKTMTFVQEYQYTMRYLVTSIGTFISAGVVSFLFVCMRVAVPFFICCAFVGFSVELYGTIFILSILIDAIMSYIPWPGASGVAEVSFTMLFSHPLVGLSGGALIWAMFLWRILTYYIYLLQGLLIMFYDYTHGNKKIPKTIEYFKKLDERRAKKNKE